MLDLILEFLKQYGVIGIVLAAILLISVTWYTAHVSAKPGERVEVFFGLVAYTKNVPVTPPPRTNTSTESTVKTHKILEILKQYSAYSIVLAIILSISVIWFYKNGEYDECNLPWPKQPLHCP